jgi:hypothetical protein
MFVVRRAPLLARMFTSSKQNIEDVIKSKGKTDEDLFFNKKDKDLLKKLVDKLENTTADLSDPAVAKRCRDNLLNILKKHNIRPSEALLEELTTWKAGGV